MAFQQQVAAAFKAQLAAGSLAKPAPPPGMMGRGGPPPGMYGPPPGMGRGARSLPSFPFLCVVGEREELPQVSAAGLLSLLYMRSAGGLTVVMDMTANRALPSNVIGARLTCDLTTQAIGTANTLSVSSREPRRTDSSLF